MIVYSYYRNSRPLPELKGRKSEDGLLSPITVITELSPVETQAPLPGNVGPGLASASPP